LTLLVGMALGWLADRARTQPERDLRRSIVSRNKALQAWKEIHFKARAKLGCDGAFVGEFDGEAEAREEYFKYRAQVEESLNALP
jgi:hypothetical protein